MSVESFGFKFVVDAKDAAKGYGDFQKAVDGVFASLTQFEAHAKKVMDNVTSSSRRGHTDIAKYTAQFRGLANIPIDGRAAPALLRLSEAMARFKAPNTTQITNMRTFFRTLGSIPNISTATSSISNIAKLSMAMNGFKAPSAGQAEKLIIFSKALQQIGPGLASLGRVAGVSGIANELASVSIALNKLKIPSAVQATNLQNFARALQMMRIGGAGGMAGMLHSLASINGFKAPSAAQTRNLVQFVHAVNTLKVPTNAGQISEYLQRIAMSANLANSSLKNFRGSLNSISWGGFASGAGRARVEMMGLQNAFSGTFQAGSLLRSLLGSLTIAELGRAFFQAVQASNQFTASMHVLGETPMMMSANWERLRADANHFGADLNVMTDNFSKFALAANENGISIQESFKIYEGFQTVMTATHLGAEQQQSVGLAIREIMDQGYVSTQRLTRQLGLVLPGAMHTLQEAWKVSGKQGVNFFDALKKKMVDGQWALDTLADHYKTVFGPGVKQALESPIQQFNILKNNIMQMMVEIGDAGAKKAFADLIRQISGYLDPSRAHDFAQAIGTTLTKAVNGLSNAFKFLHDHWDSLVVPAAHVLKLFAEWEIAMSALQIGRWIVSPLLSVVTALGGLRTVGSVIDVMAAKTLPQAAGAAAKLDGAARKAAVGILQLRNSAALAGAAMEGEAFAATTLSTRLMTLGASAGTAVAGGLRSLINFVGGPYIATFMAAGYAVYELSQTYGAAQQTIDETTKYLTESKKTVQDATDKIYLHSTALNVATKSGIDFNDCTRGATPFLDAYKNHMDKVTGGLYSMAFAARSATIETLKLQAAQNQGQMASLQVNSTSEVGKKAGELWSQGRYALSLGARIKQGTNAFSSLTGWDASQKDVNAQIGKVRQNGQDILKQLAAAQSKSVMDIVGDMKKAGMGAPDKIDPIYHGSDSEKKKKKGKDPAAALRTQENSISTLMKDLMADDPYGKLYSEFVDKLTKEGEVLLNNKAFKQFIGNMKTDADTGKVSVDALVHALQNGGIKGKVLDDLKKRYHTDVNGIIKMLYSQQAEYEQAIKDATVKRIDAEFKDVNDLMSRLAEDDPVLKVLQDYFDDIKNQAKDLLNADAYTTFMDDIASHTYTAAQATEILLNKLKDVGNLAPNLNKKLNLQGSSLSAVTGHLVKSDTIRDVNVAQKLKEAEVGTILIEQEKQAYALGGMTARQQTIANKLLDEFNRLKGLKHIMSQAEISDLQKSIGYWEKQIDLMQQQKDFYENNGIKKYISDIQTAGDFVHNFDNNVLHNLEETLYTLGTTGKLSFKGLIDGMQQDIIRFASQNLMKSFINILNPNAASEKNPTMFGFLGKMLGGSKDFTPSNKSLIEESMITPLNVTVSNGNMLFGGGAFSGSAAGGSGGGTDDIYNLLLGGPSASQSPILDPNKASSIPGSIGGSITNAAVSAQPAIQNSFMTTFKGLAMSLGPLLGGAIGGAVGGKWGAIAGTVASIGLMFLTHGAGGGGVGVPGALEGGVTGSLVNHYRVRPSSFIGAPHYADGTPNTSGGHPAILHDNEAVIPLSRGRKVPVELTGMSSSGNGGVTVHNNFNISSPDADSFRRSKSQIATDLHAAGARCWSRNNS